MAAIVSAQLQSDGLDVVVVGGSAVTSYVPDIYTSLDIDFAVLSGVDRRRIVESLAKLEFRSKGRAFVREGVKYSLDFVADAPYIEQRPIKKFATIETPAGSYRTLTVEDAVADRVAGFVHWNDRQGLDVAERFTRAMRDRIIDSRLFEALHAIDPADVAGRQRLNFAEGRLKAALR